MSEQHNASDPAGCDGRVVAQLSHVFAVEPGILDVRLVLTTSFIRDSIRLRKPGGVLNDQASSHLRIVPSLKPISMRQSLTLSPSIAYTY